MNNTKVNKIYELLFCFQFVAVRNELWYFPKKTLYLL